MTRERWLAAGLLAAGGVAAWFFALDRGAVGAASRGSAAAVRERDAERERSSALADGEAASEPRRSAPADVMADADASTVLGRAPVADAGVAIEPSPANGVAVRVLRGRGDEAVPFAVVGYSESTGADPAARLLERARGEDLGDVVARRGRFFRADAHGLVRVPRPLREARVAASAGDLWGFAEISNTESDDEIALRLLPDPLLTVRVVSGPERLPVEGADVALRYQIAVEESQTLVTRSTSADGTVAFGHLWQYTRWYWPHSEELAAVVSGLFAQPSGGAARTLEKRIEPDDPSEVVELELPPCTELEVVVVGLDHRPLSHPVLVRAGLGRDSLDALDLARTVAAVAVDGRALFRQIGPGLELELRAETIEGLQGKPVQARSAAKPGERVTVEVPFAEQVPVLAGRLIDEHGAPLALVQLQASLTTRQQQFRGSLLLATDAAGFFRCPIVTSLEGLDGVLLEFTLRRSEREVLLALRDVAGPFQPGVMPIGDVLMRVAPMLAQGRVVSESGAPVARAMVTASTRRAPGQRPRPNVYATTGEDGSFAAFGPFDQGMVLLWASHPHYGTPAPAEFPAGSIDIVLRVQGAGRIQGSAVFDEEWLADFTYATATLEGTDEESWASFERPGTFELNSLAPGLWTVVVGMEGDMANGIEVPHVAVRAGETTRDPRLQDVDLRKARVVELEIVDAAGAPIETGTLSFRAAGSVEWKSSVELNAGAASVFTLLERLDVHAYAEGYRAGLVLGLRDGARIVLQPGIAAQFRWAEALPRGVGERFLLGAKLRLQSPEVPAYDVAINVAAPGEEASTALLPAAGPCEVVYELHRKLAGRWQSERRFVQPLTIHDTAEPQEIVLALPFELIELCASTSGD